MRPTIERANHLYLFTLLLILLATPLIQWLNFYHGVLLAELLLILPTLLFMARDRLPLGYTLRLRWPGWRLLGWSALAAALAYIIATSLTAATRYLYSQLGTSLPMFIPPVADGRQFAWTLFIGGLVASIAEEVLFRGYLLRAYEAFGSLQGVIITGLLFGMFHLSFQNLVPSAFLGIVMGYLVYRTDSLWAGIVAHFTNNMIAFSIAYFSYATGAVHGEVGPQTIMFMGLLAFVSLFLLGALFRRIEGQTAPDSIAEGASIWANLARLTQTWPLAMALVIFFTMAYSEFLLVFGRL
ncbi:MAG: CPBP family intramembrane glutamic endopeptidase [Limnochordia bacterium]|jgi:membrane protease YdiL (CAAX protease family)